MPPRKRRKQAIYRGGEATQGRMTHRILDVETARKPATRTQTTEKWRRYNKHLPGHMLQPFLWGVGRRASCVDAIVPGLGERIEEHAKDGHGGASGAKERHRVSEVDHLHARESR